MKVNVKVGHIQALLLTAAKKDIRYYLNGIFFEVRDGVLFMVGTDGYRLGYIRQDAKGLHDHSVIVKRDGLETLVKGLKAYEEVQIDLEDLSVVLPNQASLGGLLQKEAGAYTNWRAVIPRADKAVDADQASLNTAYVSDLTKVAVWLGKTHQLKATTIQTLRIWVFDQCGAVCATVVGAPEYGAVIMATRLKPKDYTSLPSLN